MDLSEYITKEFGIVPDAVQLQEIKDLANPDPKENKSDLINALCFVIATNETFLESKNIANRKLLNLLESL